MGDWVGVWTVDAELGEATPKYLTDRSPCLDIIIISCSSRHHGPWYPTFLNSLILTLSIPFRLLLPILELDGLGI